MPPSTKRLSPTGKAIKRPVGRPATAGKPGSAKSGQAGRIATASPKQSKDELRARVEKLERANTMLRLKNRTVQAAVHDANDRVAELEEDVAKLQRHLAAAADAAPARTTRAKASSNPAAAEPAARVRRATSSRTNHHRPDRSGVNQDDNADLASS